MQDQAGFGHGHAAVMIERQGQAGVLNGFFIMSAIGPCAT